MRLKHTIKGLGGVDKKGQKGPKQGPKDDTQKGGHSKHMPRLKRQQVSCMYLGAATATTADRDRERIASRELESRNDVENEITACAEGCSLYICEAFGDVLSGTERS